MGSNSLSRPLTIYSNTRKFVQNIDQHLLESITNGQKNSVFREGFDSIIKFLRALVNFGDLCRSLALVNLGDLCMLLFKKRARLD